MYVLLWRTAYVLTRDYRFRDVAVTNIDIVIKVEGSLAAHMFSFGLSDDMIHGLVWFN